MKIVLKLTGACNLRCIYCYRKPGARERLPLARGFTDRLASMIEDIPKGAREVVFFGGEPLLETCR